MGGLGQANELVSSLWAGEGAEQARVCAWCLHGHGAPASARGECAVRRRPPRSALGRAEMLVGARHVALVAGDDARARGATRARDEVGVPRAQVKISMSLARLEERIIRCEGMRWVYDGQGETQEVGTVCGSELAQSGEVRRWKGREARLAPRGSTARADNIMGEEEYIYHGGEENIQRAHHAYRRETLPTHGHPRRLAKVHVIKVSRQRREGARLILRSPPGHGDCRGPKTVARLARGAREAAVSRAWLQARPRREGFWTSEDLAGWHRLEYTAGESGVAG